MSGIILYFKIVILLIITFFTQCICNLIILFMLHVFSFSPNLPIYLTLQTSAEAIQKRKQLNKWLKKHFRVCL